ncbi:DUF6339 family protein [Methylobacterium sp. WL116]|uniref:DUF6339 family protein n=1 Tax=Methylobacterium sp. WL116 TaxID=2603889 RepID=UPI0011C6F037|nr:DUF6339 family protein [Methylobacterium sp. WL116]TXM94949.1 hypothetical protein FV223_02750 [Methylobacterium sp. WL116]
MSKAKFLRSSALEDLRGSVKDNLKLYRTHGFPHIAVDQALWFEHGIEVNIENLGKMKIPIAGNFFEVENCETIFDSLSGLSPYEARDERIWTYLCHVELLDYARARWPIPADDGEAEAHIRKHFFGRDKRQIERDNIASRLWWMAHLCARVTTVDRRHALEAFLFRSDVRANLIERPTTSQSMEIFSAILNKLVASYAGKQVLFERLNFRNLMKEINSVGGFKVLECLNASQAEAVLNDIITNRMKISTI